MSSASPTLAAWLDEWFTTQRTRLEPATVRCYREAAAYLLPRFGDVPLHRLTVREIESCYASMRLEGGRHGQPLSARTVELTHAVLRKALADAVRLEVITDNPATRATLPRINLSDDAAPRPLNAWNAEQVRAFLAATADHPLADLWRVALGTGMRRGELLGLRWDDVDLTVPQLRVTAALTHVDGRLRLKTSKTGRSRTLFLDEATAAAIARQPRRPPSPFPVVFTRRDGSPWQPDVITHRWRRLVRTVDVPRITLHGVRHTHATLLLEAGVPMKVISERLGHATIGMTMDIYAHALPPMDRAAAQAIGVALTSTRPEVC